MRGTFIDTEPSMFHATTRRSNTLILPAIARCAAVTAFAMLPLASSAAEHTGWSVIPHLALSQMQDQQARQSGLTESDSSLDVGMEDGFSAGLSVRYDYGTGWVSEFGWEYRSNDSSLTGLSEGVTLPEGNYASNVFYLNGRYQLPTQLGAWQPWVGAGLAVIQEIDIDSGEAEAEISFSSSGAIGAQLMLGIDRNLSDRWYLSSEIRYSHYSDLELAREGSEEGTITAIDYTPLSLQVGLGYRF